MRRTARLDSPAAPASVAGGQMPIQPACDEALGGRTNRSAEAPDG